ncbi:MAG: hypothetical protein ACHQC8_01650 [Solirubrobacterales bacterium]
MTGSTDKQAARKGKAVEHLIAASCILASGCELNASTSLVDDEGVDIVFHRRGRSRTVAVQVKSRFEGTSMLSKKAAFVAGVRKVAFRPREDLYLLFVVVNPTAPDFGPLWLVPSHDFDERVTPNPAGLMRFRASAKANTKDQWATYRLNKAELPSRLLAILGEV